MRKLKERAIGARIEADFKEVIDTYLLHSPLSIGQLIREAIKEYMWAHPTKPLTKEDHA